MSLNLLHQAIGMLYILAFIFVVAFFYFVWVTKKFSLQIVFAVGIARPVVLRVYRVIVLLALLSTIFLYGSYLARYFLQDKLLESLLQLIFLILFLGMSVFNSIKQYQLRSKTKTGK